MFDVTVRKGRGYKGLKGGTRCTVLHIETQEIPIRPYSEDNTYAKERFEMDLDDSEIVEKVERDRIKSKLDTYCITWFLVANRENGRFFWIESTRVKYGVNNGREDNS